MDKYKKNYLIIFLIIASSVFVYGKIRCLLKDNKKFKDPLSFHTNIYVDGWLLSHFVLFLFIGYKFPNSFCLSMIFGILWEIIEILIGTYEPGILKGISNCSAIDLKKENIINVNSNDNLNWFYGRYEDMIIDFLGFVTGYFINSYKFKFKTGCFNLKNFYIQ